MAVSPRDMRQVSVFAEATDDDLRLIARNSFALHRGRQVFLLGERIERETTMVELSFTRQDLAEMAGTTFFTVSRTLSDWEKSGFIEAGREKIKNPHELVKFAEQSD